jgi:hypothetical protein
VENEWITHASVYRFDHRYRPAAAFSDSSAVRDVQGGPFEFKPQVYQKF